jgi:hypothetical protein
MKATYKYQYTILSIFFLYIHGEISKLNCYFFLLKMGSDDIYFLKRKTLVFSLTVEVEYILKFLSL